MALSTLLVPPQQLSVYFQRPTNVGAVQTFLSSRSTTKMPLRNSLGGRVQQSLGKWAPLVWLSATPEEPTSSHCPLFWGVNTPQNRGQKNWRRRDVVDAPGELVSVRSLRP